MFGRLGSLYSWFEDLLHLVSVNTSFEYCGGDNVRVKGVLVNRLGEKKLLAY